MSSLSYVFYCQQENFSIVSEINGVVPIYRYRCDWFPKRVGSYFCKIAININRQWSSKWFLSSIPWLQRHLSEGVSMKLWHVLWYLKEFKPLSEPLSWSKYRKDPLYQKYIFSLDEKTKYVLRTLKDGITLKWVITLFQEVLCLHLRNCWSLFLRGVSPLTILCICRMRLHQRLSDNDSHPNPS